MLAQDEWYYTEVMNGMFEISKEFLTVRVGKVAMCCKENLLGLCTLDSSGPWVDYMICQNRFPVLWCYGFSFEN